MSMNETITPENLRSLLDERGMKQKDLGPILALTAQQLSNMMTGNRKISESEQKLLRLYFYNEFPFSEFDPATDLGDILNFTAHEWSVIRILARRHGSQEATDQEVKDWVVSQIKSYIHYNSGAQDVSAELLSSRQSKDGGEASTRTA